MMCARFVMLLVPILGPAATTEALSAEQSTLRIPYRQRVGKNSLMPGD